MHQQPMRELLVAGPPEHEHLEFPIDLGSTPLKKSSLTYQESSNKSLETMKLQTHMRNLVLNNLNLFLKRSLSNPFSGWCRFIDTTSTWCEFTSMTSISGPTSTPSWGLTNSLGDCLHSTIGNKSSSPLHLPKQHVSTQH